MMSISVIDYIGKIKDGIAILLSLNVDDNIFEMIFWFNLDFNYTLTVQDDLLNFLNLDDIYTYKYKEELIDIIFKSLPPIEDLFDKFEI